MSKTTQTEMIELQKLLDSKWWELLLKAWKERRKKHAKEALFRQEGMLTVDPQLTQKDLLINRLMELNYCIESLPKLMVENPDYDPTKDIVSEMNEEDQEAILDEMFLQSE